MKKLFNKNNTYPWETSILSLLKDEDNLVDKYNMLIEQIDDLKKYIEDVKTLLDMPEDIKKSLIIRNENKLKKQQEELSALTKQIELIRVQIKKRI